jgi:uncharacterized membrane protein (UPF0136 family)
LSAVALIGYLSTHQRECESLLERVVVILILALMFSALVLSGWAVRFHRRRWYLLIPLVLVSVTGLGFAVVIARFVFIVPCAYAQ